MSEKPAYKKHWHILLADDDGDDRFFFNKALKKISLDTRLTMVENGEELMDYLTANSSQLPDAVFIDINMPRKNGYECLAEIKSHALLGNVPVVIYSTYFSKETAEKLYAMGAQYYLQKCNYDELPGALEKIFTVLMEPGQPSMDNFALKNLVV